MHRKPFSVLLTLSAALLACSTTDIADIVNRLPTATPTATGVPSSVLYVSKTGDDANDCLSEATACLTINAAIEKAADGAAIHIGPGTYEENDVHGLDAAAAIYGKSLSLYGAASDTGFPTIITGQGVLIPIAISGPGEVVLENMALIDGRSGLHSGLGATVTLRHAEIRNQWMAGVMVYDGTVILEDVLLTRNPGGAIDNGNDADLTVRGSRIVNNGTRPEAEARELGLARSVIYNEGVLHIVDSTIVDNDGADREHPNVISNWGEMTIERSTISGNEVGRGAAVYNPLPSTASLTNTTISGNSGLGIVTLGDFGLISSTVAGNGLSGLFGNAGEVDPMTLRLENSLIVNNASQDCVYQLGHAIVFDLRGRVLSDGSCLFEYGGHVARPPEGDAFLGPLEDNGGPTQTRALLEGSLAIDSAEGPCLATDQRGVGRPVGGGCDVGAYEFDFAVTAATPGATLVPVWTPTPEPPPLVTLIQNANCRMGPNTAYRVATSLETGVQAEAVGRDEPSTWWLVKVPQTEMLCWISGTTSQTSGNPSILPVVTVDPLPGTPGSLEVASSECSQNLNNYPVKLEWSAGSRAAGYRLYRNGSLVADVGGNTLSYTDHAPKGADLTYEVEAYSSLGASGRSTLDVPRCE